MFADRLCEQMAGRFLDEEESRRTVLSVLHVVDRSGYAPRAQVCAELCRQLRWQDPPDVADLLAFWDANFAECAVLRPGVLAAIDQLRHKDVRLALVSNGNGSRQRRKLATVGLLGTFDSIIISDEVGVRKPDARIYELALNALNVAAECAVFVGDHPQLDIDGARSAGLQTIWFEGVHPWPTELDPPDRAIRHFDELLGAIGI